MSIIDINRLGLTNAQTRDFSMIQPYLETGNWVTSISIARQLYLTRDFTNKEISKISNILSKLYHNTSLLSRKPRRRIYFHNIHKRHTSSWAYRLNPEIIKEHEI